MNLPSNLGWAHTNSGAKTHIAVKGESKTLCGAVVINGGCEGDSCKRCLNKADKLPPAVEVKAAAPKIDHAKHSHRFTQSYEHANSCPVSAESLENHLCECWHSDEVCDAQTAEFGVLAEEFELAEIEGEEAWPLRDASLIDQTVIFNGQEFLVISQSADEFGRADWITISRLDYGSVTIQTDDLESEFIHQTPVQRRSETPSTAVETPVEALEAPSPALKPKPQLPMPLTVPQPRVTPTPSILDALNLRRHIGSTVKIKGDSGRARLVKIVPGSASGTTPPGAVVEFSDGFKIECSLAEVMLCG